MEKAHPNCISKLFILMTIFEKFPRSGPLSYYPTWLLASYTCTTTSKEDESLSFSGKELLNLEKKLDIFNKIQNLYPSWNYFCIWHVGEFGMKKQFSHTLYPPLAWISNIQKHGFSTCAISRLIFRFSVNFLFTQNKHLILHQSVIFSSLLSRKHKIQ